VVSGRQKRLVAVTIGVVAAVAAMIGFSLWLDDLIDSRGRDEVDLSAQRAIRLADLRIEAALATLDELAADGVNDCNGSQVAALRTGAFFNAAVKEIAVVSSDGRMICGSSGLLPDVQTIVVPTRGEAADRIAIDVVRVGNRERMVRVLKSEAGGGGLAALIPASLFEVAATERIVGLGTFVRVATRDNMTIVEQGTAPRPGAAPFTRTIRSDRYGLIVTAALPRAALTMVADQLKGQATVFAMSLFAAVFVLALLLRRRRDDTYTEFEQAIAANEFVPYYQPVVDIRTGRLRGAEVLARWRKPDGSIVLPSAFIPYAESSGLIVPLTRALMQRACEDAGDAIGRRPDIKIGFNLAAPHFADERIVADVRDVFANSPIPLRQVVLEVTERQPLRNLAGARRVIAGLQDLGCSVAIDDVGSGHGGLSYILKLGADTIKIDKLFVDAIGTEYDSTAILQTLVDLARSMRMGVVAEGVENFEQVAKLRELGILAAQGHVFCPPLPASSFLELMEAIAPLQDAENDVPSRLEIGPGPGRFAAA
jgi:sensor c-di-GMP phosphodiesterase-like protein